MIQRLARHLILQTRSPYYLSRQAILPFTRRTDSLCPSHKAILVIRTMASDSDYTAFLDKANRQRDAGSGEAHTEQSEESSRQIRTTAVTHGIKVPEALKKVDAFYVSDSDEPFEPVALKWSGVASKKWPSSNEFAKLISSDSKVDVAADSIEMLSEKSFDPRKQYSSVIDAVREAVAASDSNTKESDVDVKIYRVEVGHSRVEYWVVALEGAEERIVGFKAKAIES